MLEVFNNLFMSIAEQMGVTLANTAYSVNIKERFDFSCAIFDGDGKLVANAPHVPVHLGSMGESVATVIRENAGSIRPGDVFMLNAPFNGGTHLPDVTVDHAGLRRGGRNHPVLYRLARPSRRYRRQDARLLAAGLARRSRRKACVIDNFRIVEAGRFREAETRALLGSGRYPCRNIDHNIADLVAQIAANETGAARNSQDDRPVRRRRPSRPICATSRTMPRNPCGA